MGLLERLFGQVERGKLRSVNTVQLWKSLQDQIELWKAYVATVDEKAALVKTGAPDMRRLSELVRMDIVDVDTITTDDAIVLKEVHSLGTVMSR
ncbi:MAG: hypothetical protein AABY13_04655, partial [Nanoarchaeota archaeon]